MDPEKISNLANLLRDSGDKVLNDNFKLTLSGQLLQALNDSFSLIIDQNEQIGGAHSFQVVTANNYSKSFVFRDLQLIYDFVQKTYVLCVTHFSSDEPFTGEIDISKFRNLRRLEISRVNVNQVRGIQAMRHYLQEIRCVHSVDRVEDIVSHCGGDKSNGFIWNQLRFADFSYNNLQAIDGSLEFASWLQHLNLSHNRIVSVDAIKWLPNLKYLNLSYNRLPHIPFFNLEATRRLKVLILSNNYIEDLSGISRLDALNELDLSENYLLDHSTLLPLSTLVALQFLSLVGNPLACHPKHRQATARYLHKNTASVKFVLDCETLSKSEKSMTGKQQSMLTNRMPLLAFGRRSNSQASSRLATKDNTPSSSMGSLRSFQLDDSKASNNSADETVHTGLKKIRPKHVVITEHMTDNVSAVATPTKADTCLEGNKDHLETKKQVELMRKQHGNSWLQSHGATIGQIGNGNRSTPQSLDIKPSADLPITPPFTPSIMQTSTPVNRKEDVLKTDSNKLKSTFQTESESESSAYYTLTEDSDMEATSKYIYETVDSEPNLSGSPAINMDDIFASATPDDPEPQSDPEDNEVTYIVTVEQTQVDMFLIVSDVNIREKEAQSGRTVTKWSMKTLESCERAKSDVLHLHFDTVKRSNQERIYRVEPDLCQQLEKYLRSILSERPLSEMNQATYKCAKCSAKFSREVKAKKIEILCPYCQSNFVVEIVETPRTDSLLSALPVVVPSQSGIVEGVLEISESHSSIVPKPTTANAWRSSALNHKPLRSAHSLNGSSSCSKISKSSSSFDSNQSVAGSSGAERDSEFGAGNGDSDVEILSNPSQSSIEVLEYNASRKHSEDRRYDSVFADPGLSFDSMAEQINKLSMNDRHQQTSTQDLLSEKQPTIKVVQSMDEQRKTVLSQAHLTESSSSGSVTDSICTTYEPSRVSPLIKSTLNDSSKLQTADNNRSPEKQSKNDTSVISSMFGGLFQSTNSLMSRSQRSPDPTNGTSCDPFRFSYTNFDEVDHRLKLYLYQTVFEDDNEHLKWLVKGHMYAEKWEGAGIFIMSTTKFYALQVTAAECDDVSKWVKRQLSGTIDRLETVRVLPWKIGFTLTVKASGQLQILLQDILRTDSLLLFLSNNPLPDWCSLEYQVSESLSQSLLAATNNEQLKMLAILNESTVTVDARDTVHTMIGIVVTENHLRLLAPSHTWLTSNTSGASSPVLEHRIECQRTQMMSNLVDSEMLSDRVVRVSFLDENHDTTEVWSCEFETEDSAKSTLSAIEHTWSKLFGVSLTDPQ